MTTYLWVAIGGMAGANARYLLSTWAWRRFGQNVPIGTMIVNVTGSFAIGLILTIFERSDGSDFSRSLVVTGFLGAYTTFSTFTWESVILIRESRILMAVGNVLASLILGFGAVSVGLIVGSALVG